VRSYDILVSFVFMPLGFLVFPLLARVWGYEETLLAAALVIAVTNLVVGFVPGVHAVTETPATALAEPRVA
jgi:Na+/melibiose symporter-like transporter